MERMVSRVSHGLIVAGGALLASVAAADPVVRSGTAENAAGLQGIVDQFRVDVSRGGGVNAPGAEPPAPGVGRREINWDAAALDAFASPGLMPGDFFNRVSRRGALLTTDGEGFTVSRRNAGGDLSDPSLRFGDVQAQYNSEFQVFSQQRLFATRGSLVYDTTFFIPTFPQARATVSGFGAVFCDVDLDNSTLVELFDASDRLIFSRNVSNRDKGLSFLGASFTDGTQIGRVRVTTGNALFGSLDGVDDSGLFHDVVVLDDFIYGEPVPAPGVLAVGVAGLLAGRRRR